MIDKLIRAIEEKKNPTVVGLDPTLEMIPDMIKKKYYTERGVTYGAVAEMFYEFNTKIIDAVADIVPAVKPQIAMYEKYGLAGIDAFMQTNEYAKKKGLVVIGDIKRGDISSTAAAYAGHLEGASAIIDGPLYDEWYEDFVTVNPYLGYDGIKPFIDVCNKNGKGIFVLVKTSNPSGKDLQDLILESGEPVYKRVGALVDAWGKESMGELGYSRVGAVVGATYPEQGVELRKAMPNTFFLVPGYGAQGASAEDLKGFFDKDGRGAIVNSSRGIIAAYKKDAKYGDDHAAAARDAAIKMKEDLARVL